MMCGGGVMKRFENLDVIITDIMASHGKWRTDKTAIICEDRRITWGEFNQRINKVANGLMGLGLQKGEKVSLLMANRIEVLEILFGTVKAGGVIVPLSAMVPGDSLARMIIDSDSKFLFVGPGLGDVIGPYLGEFKNIAKEGFFSVGGNSAGWNSYEPLLDESSDEEPGVKLIYEDSFNIMYTSGTTGVPKGILHTHHNRTQFASMFAIDYRIDSSAITIITTALYANGTWLTMLPTVFVGGTLVIMTKFEPKDFLELVQKHKCTHTFMVPSQFTVLLEQSYFDRYDLSSMRIWNSAGSPLRAQTKQKVLERFSGQLLELWGLTEGVATTLKPEDMERKMESVGLPLVGWDVAIIDDKGQELRRGEVGEIVAFSSWIMPEYYKLPDKTAEAIWLDKRGRTFLKTGDMGKLDEDGFLYILDRKKDMIISGGINIFASDIEEVLTRHPKIRDAAVIGIPHPKWGETPMALVILKEGSSASAKEVMEWVNPKLAKYQRISRLEFHNTDFPRNALGKVLKRKLREPYWKNE
jgi:acyl-CoA synthetase (AMP-forming)/AMP-acid ligase II